MPDKIEGSYNMNIKDYLQIDENKFTLTNEFLFIHQVIFPHEKHKVLERRVEMRTCPHFVNVEKVTTINDGVYSE